MMATSISSDVQNYKNYVWTTEIWNWGRENHISMFLHFCLLMPDRQTDGQNIYRIDADIESNAQRKKKLKKFFVSIMGWENCVFIFLNFCLL